MKCVTVLDAIQLHSQMRSSVILKMKIAVKLGNASNASNNHIVNQRDAGFGKYIYGKLTQIKQENPHWETNDVQKSERQAIEST